MRSRSEPDAEFLPAMLALSETPPLPAGRWLMRALLLLPAAAALWTWFARIDVVSVAHGKVISAGGVQRVQPLEAGTVQRILVSEGQSVQAGQALVKLDASMVAAELEQVEVQIRALRVERAILERLIVAAVQDDPATPAAGLDLPPALSAHERKDAALRLQSRLDEFLYQARNIDHEIEVKAQERRAAVARIAQLDATLPLVSERSNAVARLLARGLVPRMQWLELEELRLRQVHERAAQADIRGMLEAELAAVSDRRRMLSSEFESRLRTQLGEVQARLAEFTQERIKVRRRLALKTLAAPVAGRILGLAVHTEGGVVAPGEELMRVVPAAGELEVEAWVPNRDVGFVHPGQSAVIKLEAYPWTRYGTIAGRVATLSGDATQIENAGLYYAVRVIPAGGMVAGNGRRLELVPGMAAVVEIALGTRRVIEFLLSPLQRHRDEGLRER